MDPVVAVFAVINIAVLAAYVIDFVRSGRAGALLPQVASLLTMAVVVIALNEALNPTSVFFIVCFAVLFSILPSYYMRRHSAMLVVLFIIIAEFFYATYAYGLASNPGVTLYPFVQALAIGTAFGFLYRSGFRILAYRQVRANKDVEIRRDYAHFLLGIVIFAVFLTLPLFYAIYVTTTLILIGYASNSALGKRRSGLLYSLLNSIERPGTIYGLGALYLGVGTALLIGFVHSVHFLMIGMAALFFADPIATIVGSSFSGIKLPYNRRKSVYGTLAFFVTVAVVGYAFVGYYSIAFGAMLALVESIDMPLDDNIGISVTMILLYIAFLLIVNRLPFYLLSRQL